MYFYHFTQNPSALKARQSYQAADTPHTKQIRTTAMHVQSCKRVHHRCHRKQGVFSS